MQPLSAGSGGERQHIHAFLLVLLKLLLLVTSLVATVRSECPTGLQLKSLVKQQAGGQNIKCFCSEDPLPGGWEVTCIKDTVADPSVSISKSPGHEMYSLNASPLSFSIKLMAANTIEITCDESVPDFKPALFQGFNIDSVDTFRLFNCPLPTVPLSVVLHRTSVGRIFHSRNTSSYADDEVVSEVKSLRIEYSEPQNFTANQLKNIFNGLDSLEKLSLHNVQIDNSNQNHSSSSFIAPASIFYARPKRAAAMNLSSSTFRPPNLSNPKSSSTTFLTETDEIISTTLPSVQKSSPRVQSPITSPALTSSARAKSLQTSSQLSVSSSTPSMFVTPLPAPSTSARSEPWRGLLPEKEIRSGIVSDESRLPISSQKPPAVVFQESSLFDFNFNSLLPNLKNVLIESMFNEKIGASGLILEVMVKDLKNLESLQLRNNHIKRLRESTFSGSSSKLKRLYLIGNEIEELHPRVFSNLNSLELLDLFNNNLARLPDAIFSDLTSLSTLRLGKNKFHTFPENLLSSMKGLKALDLNLNKNLTILPKKLLSSCVELKNLSLTDCDLNQLSSDPSSFFTSTTALERIELRGNHLRNLTAPALFANLPSLRKIDVSYNNIVSISADIFSINSSNLLELNLYGNDLTTIDSSALNQLKNLRSLKLGFNNLSVLAPDLLFALRKLEELDLSRNQLTSVNPQRSRLPFGLGSGHLRKLNLSRNNITDFSEFSAIDWSLYLKISEIDLSRNQLRGAVLLPVFHSTANHVFLDLSSNEIISVRMGEILQYEASVLQAARDSRISETFDERSSWKPSSLTSITQVIIRLDKNPLNCDCRLESFVTYANASTRDLEAAFRGILNRVSFDFFSPELKCSQPANLANLPLHKVDPWNLTCLLEDSRVCPHECVCLYRSYDRHAYINCEDRNLESIPEEILLPSRYTNVSLSENSPDERLNVRTVSLLLSNNDISELDSLSTLITDQEPELLSGEGISFEIYLDNNRIERIAGDLLQSQQEKGGGGARVGSGEEGEERSTELSSPVKLLSLRNNLLQRIPIPFLESIRATTSSSQNTSTDSSVRLFVGNNPFNCSADERSSLPLNINECGLIFFKSWLTKNYDVVQDVKQVTCSNIIRSNTFDPSSSGAEQQQAIVEIPDSDLCPQLLLSNEGSLFALSIICLVFSCLTLVLCIAYYKNKQTFLAFIYIHVQPVFVCLNFSEQDLDEDKLYDAFLSYSSSDRDIVMEMIEKLEKPSDVSMHSISFLKQQSGMPSIHEGNSDQIVPEHAVNKSHTNKDKKEGMIEKVGEESGGSYFTLCIHERDWLPGNLISWNIVNSVQNSRRTILILSKEFIRSIWFQVEFHTAYYQMLEDKMDRLIVIVRGELPPKEEMDQDLVFLLTTKTYLTWGEKWFWEKLRYALPHRKGRPKALASKAAEQRGDKGNNSVIHMNGKMKQSKADLMKEYVDQTISDHFQLQQKTDVYGERFSQHSNHHSLKTSSNRGHVNQSFVSESEA